MPLLFVDGGADLGEQRGVEESDLQFRLHNKSDYSRSAAAAGTKAPIGKTKTILRYNYSAAAAAFMGRIDYYRSSGAFTG